MIAYVDSSVILRKLFGEPHPLSEWPLIEDAYASRIMPVEVARVIDRTRLEGRIDDEQVALLHEESRRVFASISIVSLTEPILVRAASAMPASVGTLAALHLATAIELARKLDAELIMATHDVQLGRAARASGLVVRGT